jgi:hypothetical protein
MGSAHPSLRQHQRHVEPRQDGHAEVDVEALIEENAQLRELVIQLSKLVIKNVVDRK